MKWRGEAFVVGFWWGFWKKEMRGNWGGGVWKEKCKLVGCTVKSRTDGGFE